ncbi:PREDICTED: uncharacterized protein LOC101312095 isoform 1 [Fragaria vesca subsp. vesca]
MLKFLSQVRIEFNALDPRTASCMEFLAQCNAPKAKESNPSCAVQVKRRTDDEPLKIIVTFANGVKEVFDATAMPAQSIRTMILEKGRMLETEQMFHDVSVAWPVLILAEELTQPVPGTKVRVSVALVLFFALDLEAVSSLWHFVEHVMCIDE